LGGSTVEAPGDQGDAVYENSSGAFTRHFAYGIHMDEG